MRKRQSVLIAAIVAMLGLISFGAKAQNATPTDQDIYNACSVALSAPTSDLTSGTVQVSATGATNTSKFTTTDINWCLKWAFNNYHCDLLSVYTSNLCGTPYNICNSVSVPDTYSYTTAPPANLLVTTSTNVNEIICTPTYPVCDANNTSNSPSFNKQYPYDSQTCDLCVQLDSPVSATSSGGAIEICNNSFNANYQSTVVTNSQSASRSVLQNAETQWPTPPPSPLPSPYLLSATGTQ